MSDFEVYTPNAPVQQLTSGVFTQGTALVQADDGRFRWSNARMREYASGSPTQVGVAYAARDRGGADTSTQGCKWACDFDYDGQILEFHVTAHANARYWVWVDGRPTTAVPFAPPSPVGSFRTMQIDLGSDARRSIQIQGEGITAALNGVRSGGGVTVAASSVAELPRLAWVGDSYGDGRKATTELMGFVRTLGRLLGYEAWQYPSLGGQGLIYESAAGLKHSSRLDTDLDAIPGGAFDVIVLQGSINDSQASWAGNVGPAMRALVAATRANHPDALLIGVGPLFAGTPSGTYVSIEAEIAAAMADEPDAVYISGAVSWFAGSSSYLDADGNHPNQAGHDAYAERFATEIRAILTPPPPPVTVVDIEGAVVAHLAGRADVAELAGDRIATLPPPSLADPFVRVRLLNAPQPLNSPTDYLTGYLVQIDCYAGAGGTSVDALELATAVRLAIHEMPGAAELGATITGTNIAGFQNLEDIDIEPPRPRYLVTATIWAHP